MKYLVTGACGFTGSHLVDILTERGLDFRATDLEGADRCFLPDCAEFIPSDLTEIDSLRRVLEGVDVVFHTAALFNFSAPKDLLNKVNVEGMENLCRACIEAGVKRLVSWSTCGVYGRPKFTAKIYEDTPRKPMEDYSRSKHKQDIIAHRYHSEHGLPVTIVRPGVVYGPRSKYGFMHIIETFAMLHIIPVPVNFHYHMSPVHARDVGGAALHLSSIQEAVGEEYQVVDCSEITMTNLFYFLAAVLEKPTVPVYLPPRLAAFWGRLAAEISDVASRITGKPPLLEKAPIYYFPLDLDVSNEKLLATGYKMEYPDVRLGLIETIEWLREQGRLNVSLLQKLTA
ncbi:MAG: NAD-dependent epimerase/dehydratase family protein [bacterium]